MKLQILKICQRCKAKCCKIGGPDFTKKEMKLILKAGFKDCFRKINKNHYELKSKKGVCPYLAKDNSCSIHRLRPEMCKCWPVYIKYKGNKKEYFIAQCPLTPYLSKKEIEKMKKQASKINRKILETTFLDTKLPKSDLKLIEGRFNSFKFKRLR